MEWMGWLIRFTIIISFIAVVFMGVTVRFKKTRWFLLVLAIVGWVSMLVIVILMSWS
jgi:hypothetical protein